MSHLDEITEADYLDDVKIKMNLFKNKAASDVKKVSQEISNTVQADNLEVKNHS